MSKKSKKKSTQNKPNEHELQSYIRDVTDTRLWFDKATELRVLAEIIEDRIRQAWIHARENIPGKPLLNMEEIAKYIEEEKRREKWPIQSQNLYLAIVAFAVENLCKAHIIRSIKPEITKEIEENGKLPEKLKTHKLIELVENVGFIPDKDEKILLRHFEKNAVWAARYPVPVKALDYQELSGSRYEESMYEKSSSPEEFFDHINALVDKITEHIRTNAP